MIKVIIPDNPSKLERQIKALEYQIKYDVSEKDKTIHEAALEKMKEKKNCKKTKPLDILTSSF